MEPNQFETKKIWASLQFHHSWITLAVYIGGFSAASSMIIVESIAFSTMIGNNIVMPLLLSLETFKEKIDKKIKQFVINSRRLSIVIIIFLAYLYDKTVAEKYSLVSIGMVSFAVVAQFVPAIIDEIKQRLQERKVGLAFQK